MKALSLVIQSRKRLLLVLGALILSAIWWQASGWYHSYLTDINEAKVKIELSQHARQLSTLLHKRLALLEGLATFIETDLKPEGPLSPDARQRAHSFMSGLHSSTIGLRGFVIAPQGTVDQVFPLSGNELALGHNLIEDPRPIIHDAVKKAIESRQITHSSPYELLQGGMGLVARLPIFTNEKLWGLVAIVLDVMPLLKEADLMATDNNVNMALRTNHGDIFYGNPAIFDQPMSLQRIDMPDGYWELAAQPITQSRSLTDQLSVFQLILGAFLLLLFGVLVALGRFSAPWFRAGVETPLSTIGKMAGSNDAALVNEASTGDKHHQGPPTWLAPALASAAIMLACLAFYWFLQGKDAQGHQQQLNQHLRELSGRIQQKLDTDKAYLEILAEEIAEQRLAPKGFELKGEQYVTDHPGLINITWADADFIIRHTTPYERNKQVIGLSLSLPEPERASRLARNSKKTVYTRPFVVIQGKPAFELYVPIYDQSEFFGTLGGVYSIADLAKEVITPSIDDQYVVSLHNGAGETLYSNHEPLVNAKLMKMIPVQQLDNSLWLKLSAREPGLDKKLQLMMLLSMLFVAGISLSFWMQYRESNRHWRTGEALRQSQQHFRAIAQSSPMAIVITEPDSGRIRYANIRAEEMLGRPQQSLVERNIHEFYLTPADRKPFIQALKRQQRVEGFEQQMVKDSGEQFWGSLSSQLVMYGDEQALITSITDLTEQKHYQNQLFQKANYDDLTSLPNRGLAFDRLQRSLVVAQRNQTKVALMLVDLDHFKKVNDSLGHNAGDLLLQEISSRLLSSVREGDTVARLGGDEFTVILSELHHAMDAEIIAEKVLHACTTPVVINNHEVVVGASIGIATFPDDGMDHETLIKNADAAMYQCKQQGRNNIRFYTAEMNELLQSRLQMEHELRNALERNELYLHYQPLICSESNKPVGAEALLRWHNPKLKDVSPAEFIPLAESLGLITELGDWVLQTACRDAVAWQSQPGMPRYVAINVSSHQLRNDDLVERITRVLEQTGLPADALELEITESALLENTDKNRQTFETLHQMGLRLAIDDFGTGYSSLSYLRRFPFDTLKIDRAFIHDIPNQQEANQLVSAIISMAKVLGLKIVAEGVENLQQLEFLREQKCQVFQGYYLARPMKLNDFANRCQELHQLAGQHSENRV